MRPSPAVKVDPTRITKNPEQIVSEPADATANRDVDGGALEGVLPRGDIGVEIESETKAARAAPVVEEPPPRGNTGGSGGVATAAAERRPPSDQSKERAPSGGPVNPERPATGGGVGEASDEGKPYSDSKGSPITVPTVATRREIEEGKDSQQHEGDRPAAGSSGGAEAWSEREASRERVPAHGEHGAGGGGEEIRVEIESTAIKEERETKLATGVLAGAVDAAMAQSRAGDTSNAAKLKKGGSGSYDDGGDARSSSAGSRSDGSSAGIREAKKRAQEIRSSARRRPAEVEEARKTGDDSDRSTAAVESAARESAKVAQGAASAQSAAAAAAAAGLVGGGPPLLTGGGGSGGRGERGGARGGEGGDVAAPCRLEGRVENWNPPATVDLRSSYRWADEQKASMDRIRRFTQGGTALRELIHAEVIHLDLLRHDLFC
eukprot:g5918.t2